MIKTKVAKRNGPLPKRGLPAHIVVGGKLNIAEVRAMKEAMKMAGITSKSLFVAHAVRAFVRANGIDIAEVDPAQRALPIT